MVNLCLVWIRFCIGLGDTFGDNLAIATFVASKFAVSALHASSIFQEFSAKSASHNVVELLFDKFVPVLFVDFFLLLTNSTLTTKPEIKWLLVLVQFGYNR